MTPSILIIWILWVLIWNPSLSRYMIKWQESIFGTQLAKRSSNPSQKATTGTAKGPLQCLISLKRKVFMGLNRKSGSLGLTVHRKLKVTLSLLATSVTLMEREKCHLKKVKNSVKNWTYWDISRHQQHPIQTSTLSFSQWLWKPTKLNATLKKNKKTWWKKTPSSTISSSSKE